jgi:hypothetical protein
MATIRERRVARTAFNPGGAVSFSSSGGTSGPQAAPTHHESLEEREWWVRIAVALYPPYNKFTASQGYKIDIPVGALRLSRAPPRGDPGLMADISSG